MIILCLKECGLFSVDLLLCNKYINVMDVIYVVVYVVKNIFGCKDEDSFFLGRICFFVNLNI